ncbi:MAG: biosynthetic arginine decarboxylase [Oligoflexia bacterium]|nr:biosynthetic arginine decarboxylase [Oligoflexia bacterium]MBF0366083.1 biosynthetic arginine decarboxylase [Oligoflexia bacterium]
MNWSISEADKVYNISRWGDGYFTINKKGHLCLLTNKSSSGPCIDISDVIEEIENQGIQFPVVIRFHDILRSQVININKKFSQIIEEARFGGRYFGVFPIKVNQMREVVEEILDAGTPHHLGLEVGSKSELVGALAFNLSQQALLIINGYKDEDFMKLALLGRTMGKNVIVVIEQFTELEELVRLSKEMDIEPMIGIRTKLSTEGAGKWCGSSGEHAKFGLTIPEILQVAKFLEKNNLTSSLKLLHFHLGSQVTDIRVIKDAITEGSRIYAKLRKIGLPIEYFDIGGGLGVDYDGSLSLCDSSRNYNIKEYVEDVVYILKQVCDLEDVDHPHIVSETGRAIAAPHSCVITNVFGQITPWSHNDTSLLLKSPGEHILVHDMREIHEELKAGNIQETYNDALQKKEEMISAFKLGIISLSDRAKIEILYWKTLNKIFELAKAGNSSQELLLNLEEKLAYKYLCNFSVFQSALDTWAIGQLLPVVPIQRLNSKPTIQATLADITCDSDGKIDKFIGLNKFKKTILLHELEEATPYYLGLFLTGAYQDIMGDNHNLFGTLNEVHIYADDEDPTDFYIEEVIRGHTAKDVLSIMQYTPVALASNVKKTIDKQIQRKRIKPREGVRLTDFYEKCLHEYTYLKK